MATVREKQEETQISLKLLSSSNVKISLDFFHQVRPECTPVFYHVCLHIGLVESIRRMAKAVASVQCCGSKARQFFNSFCHPTPVSIKSSGALKKPRFWVHKTIDRGHNILKIYSKCLSCQQRSKVMTRMPKTVVQTMTGYRVTHTAAERRRREKMKELFEKLKVTLGLHAFSKVANRILLEQVGILYFRFRWKEMIPLFEG